MGDIELGMGGGKKIRTYRWGLDNGFLQLSLPYIFPVICRIRRLYGIC